MIENKKKEINVWHGAWINKPIGPLTKMDLCRPEWNKTRQQQGYKKRKCTIQYHHLVLGERRTRTTLCAIEESSYGMHNININREEIQEQRRQQRNSRFCFLFMLFIFMNMS